MVLFFAVLGFLGAAALGVAFALRTAGLLLYGVRFGRRQVREIEEDRARCVEAHSASTADRMMFAQRQRGREFEPESADLAVGFGRIPQDVPAGGISEPDRVVAGHAAGLVAQGVLRGRIDGFPATVVDLEVIDHIDVAEVKKRCGYGRAAEATKDCLTVCVGHLPLRLPYAASVHVLGSGEGTHTADPGFAEFPLTRPGVREAAPAGRPPWSVRQDRLIGCVLSNRGLDVAEATGLAARLVPLAGAFPRSEPERFRLPEPAADERPASTLWADPWVRGGR
ncbi:hypothetical protein ACIF8T_25420 [Streptomyces sp. NPDC085946]|uniref:hypothetical protein n=1 Tax=Streptomyces sp. NPDC085946 TaxID=3365744 RepID=UPI0037D45D2B